MRIAKLVCLSLLTVLVFGCGYSSKYNAGGGAMTGTPTISQSMPFSPPSASVGQAFTLTVNGTNFAAGSVIYFNTTAHTTMYATSQQISTNISSADTASAGMIPVYVRSNSQNSNTVNFPVQ